MAVAFVRQLGAEPGVQLNPLQDSSEVPSGTNADQIFGIIMRATRGRIDKPFVVDSSNVYTKLGSGEPIRVSALNEAWVHVVEALTNGAYQAVVQRLSTSQSMIKWAVIKKADPDGELGAGNTFEFSTSEVAPAACFIAVKHLECFNDGIKVRIHADQNRVNGKSGDADVVTLQILDPANNEPIYEFVGSLKADARDDYGNSFYLPDVVGAQTDAVEVLVGVQGAQAVIKPDEDGYGYDSTGSVAWAESERLICFTEGSLDYSTEDYVAAKEKLQYTQFDFAYLSSGGTQSKPLLLQLAKLAHDTNRQLRFDVPGTLDVEGAIKWVEDLNFGAQKSPHLLQAFWSPLKADDPTGVNPKSVIGTATLNIAQACARNAVKNAKGFAAKNHPIAGRNHQVARSGIVQICTPKKSEPDALAKAKINPVVFETYSGGGRYVFLDSLTCAPVEQSQRKLIAVAEMSTDIDDKVTRACKDNLQMPMAICIKRTKDYLEQLFTGAQASGWLVPSNDPAMGGGAFRYQVQPNALKPYDAIDVSYWLRYDGTTRQIYVTQTLTK